MLKKTFLILAGGFIFQFLISCDINCNSGPSIEMVYADMKLFEKTRIDGNVELVEDSVRMENFILGIGFDDQEKELAQTNEKLHFGFNTAQALDCGPYYIYLDKVEDLSIIMISSEDSSNKKDVTDLFIVKSESSTYNIKELIDRQLEEERGANFFNLSLSEYDGIYKKCTFKVTAILQSGETFVQETEEIVFMD